MVDDLVTLLRDAETGGLQLDLTGEVLVVSGPREADPPLIERLRLRREDLAVLVAVAADLGVDVIWCAEQLAPDDYPAELGKPCIRKFIELCIERDRPLPGSLEALDAPN